MNQRLKQIWALILGLHVIAATIYYLLGIHHQLGDLLLRWP